MNPGFSRFGRGGRVEAGPLRWTIEPCGQWSTLMVLPLPTAGQAVRLKRRPGQVLSHTRRVGDRPAPPRRAGLGGDDPTFARRHLGPAVRTRNHDRHVGDI